MCILRASYTPAGAVTISGRPDPDHLVLLDALGVLSHLDDHGAFAADYILGSPAELRIYLAHDGLGPNVGVCLGARGHAGEANDLNALVREECPHQALAELGLFLLYVLEHGPVGAILENLVYSYIHSKTHGHFLLLTCVLAILYTVTFSRAHRAPPSCYGIGNFEHRFLSGHACGRVERIDRQHSTPPLRYPVWHPGEGCT